MQSFPPSVVAYTSPTRPASGPVRAPDEPVTDSPTAFLLWVLRKETGLIAVNVAISVVWLLPGAVNPWLMGNAVNAGIVAKDFGATAFWSGLMLLTIAIGVLGDVLSHTSAVAAWLVAMDRVIELVSRKVAQLGHVLVRRVPTGEMLSVASSDSDTFGMLAEVVGRSIASLLSFLMVAGIVLSASPRLGLIVLIAAPVLVGVSAPVLRPLQRAQAIERERNSILTGMATDIVAGLRILRGIGGEQTFGDNYENQSQSVRRAGVRVGTWWAAVDAISVGLSGLLLVLLTWAGTNEMLAGRLNIGQLISFFGYAVFLVRPIQTFFELAQKWTQALVSARKTIGVLNQEPPWGAPAMAIPLPTFAQIVDEASGLVATPGELTIVVSALPDESAAVADRIGRYLPTEVDPIAQVKMDDDLRGKQAAATRRAKDAERARLAASDQAKATGHWGVSIGGVDLGGVDLVELRRTVLVSDAGSAVFSGTLQELIDPHGRASREVAEEAMHVACAEDVYDALPGGWQGHIDERGRGLSGGQRQRMVLARALVADPPVLVLVEPTSAVDAHTEARIAERLPKYRAGKTTIVTTVSPLWLHHADRVVLLVNGKVEAYGKHANLMLNPAYRSVVVRGEEA